MFASRRSNPAPVVIGVAVNSQHIAYATIAAGDDDAIAVLHALVTAVWASRPADATAQLKSAIDEWVNDHNAVVAWSNDMYAVPPHTELLIPVIDGIRQQVSWYVHAPRARRAQPIGDMRIAEIRAASLSTLRTRVARARDDDDGHMRHIFFHDR